MLTAIRDAGALAGLALNPETSLEEVRPFLGAIDLLLVMTVHPGKGGQSIEPGWVERIATARRMRDEAGARFLIEVDGGIKAFNAAQAVDRGGRRARGGVGHLRGAGLRLGHPRAARSLSLRALRPRGPRLFVLERAG